MFDKGFLARYKTFSKSRFPHGVFCKTASVQRRGGRGRRVQAARLVTCWGRGSGSKSCRTYCMGTHPHSVFCWHYILPASTSPASLCCLCRWSVATENYRQYWLFVTVLSRGAPSPDLSEGLYCTSQQGSTYNTGCLCGRSPRTAFLIAVNLDLVEG